MNGLWKPMEVCFSMEIELLAYGTNYGIENILPM